MDEPQEPAPPLPVAATPVAATPVAALLPIEQRLPLWETVEPCPGDTDEQVALLRECLRWVAATGGTIPGWIRSHLDQLPDDLVDAAWWYSRLQREGWAEAMVLARQCGCAAIVDEIIEIVDGHAPSNPRLGLLGRETNERDKMRVEARVQILRWHDAARYAPIQRHQHGADPQSPPIQVDERAAADEVRRLLTAAAERKTLRDMLG